jgi:hypothetical protein
MTTTLNDWGAQAAAVAAREDWATMLEYHTPSDRDLRDPEYLEAYATGRAHGQAARAIGHLDRFAPQRHTPAGRGYADGYRFGWAG